MNDNIEKDKILERQAQWALLQKPLEIDSSTYLLTHNDFKFQNISNDLESENAIDKCMELHHLESFVAYVNKYKEKDTMVVVNSERLSIKAIVDYHGNNRKDLCMHHAQYKPQLAEDWSIWNLSNKKKMSQYDFALFIEDQVENITEPSGAEMLEMATKFKVVRNSHFSKGVNLNTGEIQFSFRNENEAGTITTPSEFKIALPVFEYAEAYELTARLRYRLNDDQLVLWYELRRPDKAKDLAIEAIKEKIIKTLHKDIFVVMGE